MGNVWLFYFILPFFNGIYGLETGPNVEIKPSNDDTYVQHLCGLTGYQGEVSGQPVRVDPEFYPFSGGSDASLKPTVETSIETKMGAIGTIYLSQEEKLKLPPRGPLYCRLIITACSSCVIRVKLAKPPPDQCDFCSVSSDGDCAELSMEEPSYNRTRQFHCEKRRVGDSSSHDAYLYVTESYKLQINYQRSGADKSNVSGKGRGSGKSLLLEYFPLTFEVVDNTVARRGKAREDDSNYNFPSGYIQSPNYPDPYRQGVSINYTLVSEDNQGLIRLVFLDFQLHYMSSLTVYDSNNMKVVDTLGKYGSNGRPTPVQSTGQSLFVVFQANHYIHEIGFRAQYTFVKDPVWIDRPNDNCDKSFHDKGGVIDIPSMGLPIGHYVDCVWIIEKARYSLPLYDQLFLKVHEFSIGTQSRPVVLEIRRGKTSNSPSDAMITGPVSREQLARNQPAEGFTTAIGSVEDPYDSSDGFYIRLTGYISSFEGLEITFAQFYRWATAMCNEPNDFHCANGRCIISKYRCDSHDHCGDYSDEERCAGDARRGSTPPINPGNEPLSPLPQSGVGSYTMTIILVVGLVGLTLVMLMVTFVIARIYRQRLIRRLTQLPRTASDANTVTNIFSASAEAVISQVIANSNANGGSAQSVAVNDRRFFIFPHRENPVFEAPPTYDDALKHPQIPPGNSANRHSAGSTSSAAFLLSPGAEGVDNLAFMGDSGVRQRTNSTATATLSQATPSTTSTATTTIGASQVPTTPVDLGTLSHEHSRNGSADSTSATSPLNGILTWARHKVNRGSTAVSNTSPVETVPEVVAPEEIKIEGETDDIELGKLVCSSGDAGKEVASEENQLAPTKQHGSVKMPLLLSPRISAVVNNSDAITVSTTNEDSQKPTNNQQQ